ncbi:glycine--tRNA ligase subunit beta, partial [Streptococcus pyogenes]
KMMGQTPKDIKDAVLAGSTFVVPEMLAAAQALVEASKEDSYKPAVESLSRVFNLAEKAEATVVVDATLFENEQEKVLADSIETVSLTGNVAENIVALFALSTVIN